MHKKAESCTSILFSLTQKNTDLCAQPHDHCDLCYLCCSMYCLCVNVYCHLVTTQLQLINVSYHISYVTQGSLTKCQELYKNNLTIQSVCSSQEWFYTCHSYEYLSTTFMFHYLAHCHIIVGLNVFASHSYISSSHVPFKADSHIVCCAHAMPMLFPCHAVR
jgi:hypothetical protein